MRRSNSSEVRVRPAGRVLPVTQTRPKWRLPLVDPFTYLYAVAALAATAALEDAAGPLLTYLHLH